MRMHTVLMKTRDEYLQILYPLLQFSFMQVIALGSGRVWIGARVVIGSVRLWNKTMCL